MIKLADNVWVDPEQVAGILVQREMVDYQIKIILKNGADSLICEVGEAGYKTEDEVSKIASQWAEKINRALNPPLGGC